MTTEAENSCFDFCACRRGWTKVGEGVRVLTVQELECDCGRRYRVSPLYILRLAGIETINRYSWLDLSRAEGVVRMKFLNP